MPIVRPPRTRVWVSSRVVSVGVVVVIILAGFASYTLLLGTTSAGSPSSSSKTSTSARSSTSSSTIALSSTPTTSSTSRLTGTAPSGQGVSCTSNLMALTNKVVKIRGFNFVPANITVVIAANNTIRWENRDLTNHTVTSEADLFDSGPMAASDTFTCTFGQVGTFSYRCSIHPFMRGKVVARLP